jgi:hypothetical protein
VPRLPRHFQSLPLILGLHRGAARSCPYAGGQPHSSATGLCFRKFPPELSGKIVEVGETTGRVPGSYYPYPRVAPHFGAIRASCLWLIVSSKSSTGFDHINMLNIPIYNRSKFHRHCFVQICAKHAHACEGPVGWELQVCATVFIL